MTVFLIAAITVDGFIGRSSQHLSTTWTSQEDKKWFNERTKQAGVIVMGSKTFATIGRALPGRLTVVMTKSLDETKNSDQLWFTDEAPAAILKKLAEKGFNEVAICGGASIYTLFMQEGLINTLYLTLEPVVFGEGVPLFNHELQRSIRLAKSTPLSDQTLLLEYEVNN